MDGATSATDVTVRGGGKGAIALGVMVQFDFGDAPASYGEVVPADPTTGGGTEPPPDTDGPLPDTGGPRFGLLLGGLVVLAGGICLIAMGRRTPPRGRTS